MIGELITVAFIEKKGLVDGVKFAILATIVGAIFAFVINKIVKALGLPDFITWIAVLIVLYASQKYILRYFMKYPEKRITKIVLTAYGINLVLNVLMIAVIGVVLLSMVGITIGASTRAAGVFLP